jgi:hypothetical protein
MADAKRTKRVRDASESLSLDEHIAAKRVALLAARQEAPALRGRRHRRCAARRRS